MLINRKTLTAHGPWIIGVVLATVFATAAYLLYAGSSDSPHWPGGSSPPGLTVGIVAALIMLFEFLLWPRKWPQVRACDFWAGQNIG